MRPGEEPRVVLMQLHSCWDLVEGPSASVPAPSPHSALRFQWENEKGQGKEVAGEEGAGRPLPRLILRG